MGKQDKAMVADGPSGTMVMTQCGALCWRMRGAGAEILLITSRDTGRWIIPKGWPIDGLSLAEAAAIEAWEEAGVEGGKELPALGAFSYRKGLEGDHAVSCVVEVFSFRVDRLAERFPEKGQRRRKWFSPKKAAKKVAEPELRRLILDFSSPQVRGARKTASHD